MQLVVGRIVSVQDHPGADKLYVMQIDVGGETRQSVAGLKPYLKPEELEGKLVAVVANLQPADLRGVTSQCMILAAQEGDRVVILTPAEEIAVGSTIR
jgi:methionyl-tRNA synthetase